MTHALRTFQLTRGKGAHKVPIQNHEEPLRPISGNVQKNERPEIPKDNRPFVAIFWSGREDLNLRPLGPEPKANATVTECF